MHLLKVAATCLGCNVSVRPVKFFQPKCAAPLVTVSQGVPWNPAASSPNAQPLSFLPSASVFPFQTQVGEHFYAADSLSLPASHQLHLLPQGPAAEFSVKMSTSLALSVRHQWVSWDRTVCCGLVPWGGGCASISSPSRASASPPVLKINSRMWSYKAGGREPMCSPSVIRSCVERLRFRLLRFGPPGSFFPNAAQRGAVNGERRRKGF